MHYRQILCIMKSVKFLQLNYVQVREHLLTKYSEQSPIKLREQLDIKYCTIIGMIKLLAANWQFLKIHQSRSLKTSHSCAFSD